MPQQNAWKLMTGNWNFHPFWEAKSFEANLHDFEFFRFPEGRSKVYILSFVASPGGFIGMILAADIIFPWNLYDNVSYNEGSAHIWHPATRYMKSRKNTGQKRV